jgi:hypothetical protein
MDVLTPGGYANQRRIISLQKIPEMTIMAMDPRTSANHEAGHAVMHPGGMERVKEWLAPQVRDGGL